MQTEKKTSEKTVLIIDDDRDIGEALQTIISSETNYRSMWIAESDLALLSAPYVHPAVILLDYLMPVMNGLRLYDRLQELENMRDVAVVLISAAKLLPFDELDKRGIHLLRKPFEIQELLDLLALLIPEE